MTTTTTAKTAALEALIDAYAIELKLPTVRRRFRALAAEATREQQTPVAYLGALLEAEIAERAERRERRRLNDARFPAIKRLQDFRFADNAKVPQATIAALAEGSWIDDRESIIFVGDSGTGKTMLATALAVCACQQGRRVRFTTLAGLANELQEAEGRRELARVVGRYARTELVVLDELGYLALPDGAAELVFQVLSERHERGSLIVTTNLPFGEWTKVFNDPRLAKAVVDRLTHRAHIIDTGNESWRFRHGLTRNKKGDRPPHPMTRTGWPRRSASPSGLDSTATPARPLRQDQPSTTTDARWSHFKRPSWGHCKRPRRVGAGGCDAPGHPTAEQRPGRGGGGGGGKGIAQGKRGQRDALRTQCRAERAKRAGSRAPSGAEGQGCAVHRASAPRRRRSSAGGVLGDSPEGRAGR
jgi:DNA replication protein DnaC